MLLTIPLGALSVLHVGPFLQRPRFVVVLGGLCLVRVRAPPPRPGAVATPRVGKQPGVDAILLWARCVCQAAGAGARGAGGAKGSRHGWIHHPRELQ